MQKLWWILKFIWTFPISLSGVLNRKERVRAWKDHPVYIYRIWAKGFATAHWPTILVGRKDSAQNVKLMYHEARHLQQQLWVGGLIFLLTYGLMFLGLWIWNGFNWRPAYLGVWWEVDARKYANKMVKRLDRNTEIP